MKKLQAATDTFILMHVSIFGVAPLIVVRLIERLNENRDAFTHDEQVRILEGIVRIEAALKCQETEVSRNEERPS